MTTGDTERSRETGKSSRLKTLPWTVSRKQHQEIEGQLVQIPWAQELEMKARSTSGNQDRNLPVRFSTKERPVESTERIQSLDTIHNPRPSKLPRRHGING